MREDAPGDGANNATSTRGRKSNFLSIGHLSASAKIKRDNAQDQRF
jgi:hypothetical protein